MAFRIAKTKGHKRSSRVRGKAHGRKGIKTTVRGGRGR